MGHCSCRSQSIIHIKQFNTFLSCHAFSLLLGNPSNIIGGTCYGSHIIIHHYWWIELKTWKIYKNHKRSLFTVICNLPDELFMASHDILSRYNTWANHKSNKRILWSYFCRIICTRVILSSCDLILHLYICGCFSQLGMVLLIVCKSLCA